MKTFKCLFVTAFAALLFFPVVLSAQDTQSKPLPQFLFPEFSDGVTVMKDGKRFTSSLNYNMADEIMISHVNGVYRYATRSNDIDTIILQSRKFIPVAKAFYEVLASGPVTILLQNKCLITPRGANVGYGAKSRSVGPTEYKRFEFNSTDVVKIELPENVDVTPASVYWVRKDNDMVKFMNEKQFLKIFPAEEARLKAYIKENHLNLKVREDVMKLGKFFK
jgi:hypothetical protein